MSGRRNLSGHQGLGGHHDIRGGQDLHSHTIYCDGKGTPEEMARGAIGKGCASFGFSGHSYADFDAKHTMSVEDTQRYISDVTGLREKYADEIEIFLGIEQEYYAGPPAPGFDFVIGAVHYIKNKYGHICVDYGEQGQKRSVDEHFGGDYYSFARAYFETVAEMMRGTGVDVVAHFDLITKYNTGGKLFDETHPRYRSAAVDAMDDILKKHRLFEVNTGAMYRLSKPEPYPSLFLLKELSARGGEVILSSDSHDAESICYRFGDMHELLKNCGFKYTKRLTQSGFVDVAL